MTSEVSIDAPETEDISLITAESISTVLMPETIPTDVTPRKHVPESIVVVEQDIQIEKGRF